MLDNVSLNQLRVFVTVCDEQSFSRASRRLGRAQSAISHAIAALEAALGLVLFDRSGRRPQLTDAARSLLADARAILARTEEMKTRALSLLESDTPVLSLAIDAFFPVSWLLPALHDLQSHRPELIISLLSTTLISGESLVLDGTCGLALVTAEAPMTHAERVETRYLCEGRLVAVCAPSHPLANIDGEISESEFERHVQLVVSAFSPMAKPFSKGVLGERNWFLGDLAIKHDFLLAGLGWGNMPEDRVANDIAQGKLVRLASRKWGTRALPLVFATASLRGRVPTQSESWLVERIRLIATAANPVGSGNSAS